MPFHNSPFTIHSMAPAANCHSGTGLSVVVAANAQWLYARPATTAHPWRSGFSQQNE
ncbi:MAG: hypothetical protein V4717_23645 [Bacteroidota bacterium]